MQKRILVKGAGEQASATAHRLFCCGFQVLMTEVERPWAVRRMVSFCEAIFSKEIAVEGVRAVGYNLAQADMLDNFGWDHIPVFVDPESQLITRWKPEVVIDARILKVNRDNRIDNAPLVIGFGPGLLAGRDVHYVIETNRGHNLGRVIASGFAEPDTGVPGEISGYAQERVLRAPATGKFQATKQIGDVLAVGEVVANIDGCELLASVSGVLRGLIASGLEVKCGQKIGDIDPRAKIEYCYSISDKARNISGSALEIIIAHFCGRVGMQNR